MADRLDLQSEFESILGTRNVYFNPPSSVKMRYPAIRYSLSNVNTKFANNSTYSAIPSYEVTLIDDNPDTQYLKQILQIPYCRFNRFYIADNLNHWVFTIHNQ